MPETGDEKSSFAAAVENILNNLGKRIGDETPIKIDAPAAPFLVPERRTIDPRHMTLIDYLTQCHPGILDFLIEPPDVAFADDELWMDFREAGMGLAPRYDESGKRLWHPALLGWAVHRMTYSPGSWE